MIDSLKEVYANSKSGCTTLITVLSIIKKAKERYSEDLRDAYSLITNEVKVCEANEKIIGFGNYICRVANKYKESALKIEQEAIFSLKDYLDHYSSASKKMIQNLSEIFSTVDKNWSKYHKSNISINDLSKSLDDIYGRYAYMTQSKETNEYLEKLKLLETEYMNYKTISDIYNKTVTECNIKIKEKFMEFEANEESRDSYLLNILQKPELVMVNGDMSITVPPW